MLWTPRWGATTFAPRRGAPLRHTAPRCTLAGRPGPPPASYDKAGAAYPKPRVLRHPRKLLGNSRHYCRRARAERRAVGFHRARQLWTVGLVLHPGGRHCRRASLGGVGGSSWSWARNMRYCSAYPGSTDAASSGLCGLLVATLPADCRRACLGGVQAQAGPGRAICATVQPVPGVAGRRQLWTGGAGTALPSLLPRATRAGRTTWSILPLPAQWARQQLQPWPGGAGAASSGLGGLVLHCPACCRAPHPQPALLWQGCWRGAGELCNCARWCAGSGCDTV